MDDLLELVFRIFKVLNNELKKRNRSNLKYFAIESVIDVSACQLYRMSSLSLLHWILDCDCDYSL